jgi:long-chain acyl-CoA synthetase
VAVIFRDVKLTYRELDERVNAFAHALMNMGICKGQTVGLFMKNCPEYLISWFAVTRVGAIVSPLNPSYKEHEVTYQLNNSEAVALVTQYELLPLVETLRAKIPTLKRVISIGPDTHVLESHLYSFNGLLRMHPVQSPAVPKLVWEEVVALPYSSGTTGLPKGVMLSHRNLVSNACQSLASAPITSLDRLLIFLPLYHIYGIMLIGAAIMSGATIVLMERFEASECLRLIQEEGITLLFTVPYVLGVLSDWPHLDDYDLHTVKYAKCGASPVLPSLVRRFQERTHIPVVPAYGLTEASPETHTNPVNDQRPIKIETIGLPIHDTKQKIVDVETGERELEVGEEGELIIQGPQVMQGYWQDPKATSEVIRNGWLYTGDIGHCDDAGYITITDRKKDLIKYKGFSIAPAELETVLLEHPAIIDVAVIAQKHEEVGERPKAFVVLRKGYEKQDANELMRWVNGKLAAYKMVHEIEFIAAIPRNPSGKILRRVLRVQEEQKKGVLPQ